NRDSNGAEEGENTDEQEQRVPTLVHATPFLRGHILAFLPLPYSVLRGLSSAGRGSTAADFCLSGATKQTDFSLNHDYRDRTVLQKVDVRYTGAARRTASPWV